MKITSVRVYPVANGGSIVANASITIDDAIVIYVKLMNGKYGYFLSLPHHSYEDESGETVYKDDVYFLSKDYVDMVIDAIVAELDKGTKPKSRKSTRK